MAATPSPNFNDSQLLSGDPTFQNRCRQALIATCLSIKQEDPMTVPFHRERETFVAAVMNAPDSYKELIAMAVAGGITVVNDATQNGTVPLTAGNVATQQMLVTDQHINQAITNGFNTYFRTPAQ
jgi:hypothetical protein